MTGPESLSFEPLTPLSFLDRSALVHRDRVAVVDGELRFTYAQLRTRCRRLAGMLSELEVQPGDRVAVLAPNTRLLLEAHYGVPAAGAVLVALNVRLRPVEIAHILDHSGAQLLLCDSTLAGLATEAAGVATSRPRVVTDDCIEFGMAAAPELQLDVEEERSLLSINYTSGTTGAPKGVMYHHRGAYLQSLSLALHVRLDCESAFLWTLPMFHCNGWCFTWAVTAAGGTHVCLPKVDGDEIWRLIDAERITHLNGAPTVLTMIAGASNPTAATLHSRIHVCTGGAPPSPTLLEQMDHLGFDVTHLYGLTETFGPNTICEKRPEWAKLSRDEFARINARQGVGHVAAVPPRVIGLDGTDVPEDGATVGEIAARGNGVMLGYYRAPELTEQAAPDGWFRTGDLAVVHPDGYIEIRDRSKDVIISGGENIASVEVEQTMASHPAVLEAAVVGEADEKWGEVPVAFVTLRPDMTAEPDELIDHVKQRIARYKAPRRVIFGELPRTSTGKIMKYALREELRHSLEEARR
jgi:fatty-acyl-CoA synthase